MEEGSLRVDCNVSVRRDGEPLGTRCEIKNVNSLRSLGRAIEYEAARQIDLIESGERVVQQTRHWNEDDGRTHALRSKEEATDYRYFPEPDLVTVDPDPGWIEEVRASLPPLPRQRRAALVAQAGAATDTATIVVERGLDALVLAAIDAGGDPARILTHAHHDLADERSAAIPAGHLAELSAMEVRGDLTATQAKAVIADMIAAAGPGAPSGSTTDPVVIAATKGFEAMESSELEGIVDGLIAAHAQDWAKFCAGEQKVMGFFVGQVMKATGGKADGKAVSALLQARRG